MVHDPDEMVGRYLTFTAAKLKILAKAQAGVKTGALRSSINYRIVKGGGGLVALIGSDNHIAFMHHEGTRPHIIAARRAQTLRFYSRGKIRYAKVVRHPGTKPNRYLTDNLRKVI
jgi:hypothetical protein